MSFVNPWFLAASGLIAVPIIIHLLNRRKFRIIDWAAMEFLLEAFRERRRRMQIEHLLLLLVRCLLVLLIVFLAARPFFESSFLSSALGGGGTERILLIDDSASMRASVERGSAFERSVSAAGELVGRLAAERPGDRVVLVRASQPDRRWFAADRVGQDLSKLRESLGRLTASHRRVTLDAALGRFQKALLDGDEQAAARTRVVYLFSDFRRVDWSERAKTAQTLKPMIQDGPWVLADAGAAPDTENLTLLDVRTDPPIPVVGIGFRFVVRVRNNGARTARNVRIGVELGGARLPVEQIPQIAPGAEAAVEIRSQRVERPGWQHVRVKFLDNDRLAADNEHHLALRVRRGVEVLIVDGEGSALPEERESYFLVRALDPRGRYRSGIAPKVVSPAQFLDLPDLSAYDMIVLANTLPDETRLAALERYVKGGGALVLALGERIAPEEWNRLVFKDGKGMVPVRLEAPIDLLPAGGSRTDPVHFLPVVQGPPLEIFRGATNPLRRQVHIFRAFRARLPETLPAGMAVLCRFTNADGAAAIVTHAYGRGRTLLVTTPLDLAWNDWPKDPSYLVFAQDLVSYMTAHRGAPPVRRPGALLAHPLDPTAYAKQARFLGPDSKEHETIKAQDREGGGEWLLHAAGEQPGINLFKLTSVRGAADHEQWFATNVDPLEGQLRRIEPEELKRALPDKGYEFVTLTDEGAALQFLVGAKREIWRALAWALAALLVLESILAFRFGRPQ